MDFLLYDPRIANYFFFVGGMLAGVVTYWIATLKFPEARDNKIPLDFRTLGTHSEAAKNIFDGWNRYLASKKYPTLTTIVASEDEALDLISAYSQTTEDEEAVREFGDRDWETVPIM